MSFSCGITTSQVAEVLLAYGATPAEELRRPFCPRVLPTFLIFSIPFLFFSLVPFPFPLLFSQPRNGPHRRHQTLHLQKRTAQTQGPVLEPLLLVLGPLTYPSLTVFNPLQSPILSVTNPFQLHIPSFLLGREIDLKQK